MGLAALAGVGASAAVALDRTAPGTRTATLRFPADLSAGQVRAVLDTVASLRPGAVVRLGLRADHSGISFDVTAVPGLLTTFTRTVAGIAPSLRVDALPAEAAVERHPGPDVRGARLSWRGTYPLLRSDEPEAMVAALLGAVSQLRRDERLWLQLALMPAGRRRLPVREAPDRPDALARLLGVDRVSPDQRRAVVAKYQLPLLRVGITVAVQTPHRLRHAQLVARVTAVLRTRTGLRGGLQVRRLSPQALSRAWSRSPRRGTLLSASEAVALTGWPLDAPAVPGMQYGTAPRLLPAQEIPGAGPGRLFGVSTWPGHEERRVIQPSAGTTCHSLLLGPSGSGKSWLLANLALGQLAADEGIVLLDMKGDTAADVLRRLDPSRHDDVLILEPSNGLAVPGLRCFSGEPELAADLWLSIFRGLFKDSWGVRSERYLRMAFVTLATSDPGSSVADVPRLFADARYRRRLVAGLSDPLLVGQWAEFEALGALQRAEHLVSPLGKVGQLVGRRVVRSVLAQAEPKLTIRAAIECGLIVVVSLPPGRLGGPAAQLLGALVVYEVFQTIMARQALDPSRRRPLGFYLDEPAVLGSLPVPLDSLFETARGMNCGVTMAAQSLSQLPAAVQRAATTNAATIAAFRPGAEDATRIARELPGLSGDELQRLDPFTVALRLGLGPGQVAPVCTVRTLPLGEPTTNADAVRQASSQRYGREPEAVDAALRARHGLDQSATNPEADSAGTTAAVREPGPDRLPLGERGRAS
jgi:hypothetical protein